MVTATLIDFSISLLVCSLSADEKCVKLLLLFDGRVLIIIQVSSDVKLAKANVDWIRPTSSRNFFPLIDINIFS